MHKTHINKIIVGSSSTGGTSGSDPEGCRFKSYLPSIFKVKDMEKETENLDSEPPAQRCCKVGFMYRETEYDFKDYSHRHCAISSEGEKSLY